MRGLLRLLGWVGLAGLAGPLLAGCAAVGPDYVRPAVAAPAAYKEAMEAGGPWAVAVPQEADATGPWWARYGDATLNALVQQATRGSLDVQVAEARVRQARAAVQGARANFLPQVGANASVGRGRSQSSRDAVAGSDGVGLSASWEPDLWGRVRRGVEASEASAQASAADLAAARLALQAALVQAYLQLRIDDVQRDLLARTVADDDRAWALARSQHEAGVATGADVALAETQRQSTQAQALDVGVQRSQLEHALAVLLGRSPAEFTLAARAPDEPMGLALPAMPAGVPSALLQRRPDIAGAERRAAAANAAIGVAAAAYYPSFTLGASAGTASTVLGTLFDTPSRVWSLGAALAGTLFDGGARRAQTAQAQAAFDAAAAQYKASVLGGFQEVEDNLAALRILADEAAVQDQAVAAARRALNASLAQYREGTGTYLAVVTSQTLALANQRSAVQLLGRRLQASAALVKALGGGWDASQLDTAAAARAAEGS